MRTDFILSVGSSKEATPDMCKIIFLPITLMDDLFDKCIRQNNSMGKLLIEKGRCKEGRGDLCLRGDSEGPGMAWRLVPSAAPS